MILALETSCDDTCAAVLSDDGVVRSNVVSSQGVHDRFGGVVPEIAARRHLELIDAVVGDALSRAGAALDEIDRVAVTRGPGLVGALLVGLATGKALAAARRLPLTPVDHLHGHVAASFLADPLLEPPFLALVVSGGHSFLARVRDRGPGYEILGSTLDDAAGEAFDKGARMLGLGYPGGAALERLAGDGDPGAFDFPAAAGVGGMDMSFAGVKTSLLYAIRELGEERAVRWRADLAASYQAAIVAQLRERMRRGLEETGLSRLALGGGVAANGPLRAAARELVDDVVVPPIELCTDNAAMIGAAARWAPALPFPDYLGLDAYAGGERGGG